MKYESSKRNVLITHLKLIPILDFQRAEALISSSFVTLKVSSAEHFLFWFKLFGLDHGIT